MIGWLLPRFCVGVAVVSTFARVFASEAAMPVVRAIEIRGLTKSRPTVVRRELLFREGETLAPGALEESLTRLKNLEIFSRVEGRAVPLPPAGANQVRVELEIEDRWTTIPFFNAGGGGGVTAYRMGLYDINVFGSYQEVGVQYENLNGDTHSGVVWYRNPRFADQWLRVGVDLWWVTRNRDLYFPDATAEGAYSHRQARLRLFADKEIRWYFVPGVQIDVSADQYSDSKLSEERRALNSANGVLFPVDARTVLLGAYARIGRLNTDIYLVEGQQARVQIDLGASAWGSQREFLRVVAQADRFWLLPHRANIGVHAQVSHTSSNDLDQLYYLGGFNAVRGYLATQFRGRNAWQGNLEYRIPSAQSRWLVLQHVAFADAGRVGDTFGGLWAVGDGVGRVFYSFGTGLRVISPRVYSFNGRVDIARSFGPGGGWGISFGTQQFF